MRYGYLDMPENYTDIGYQQVIAACAYCGQEIQVMREDCWTDDNGNLLTDCMCNEVDENEMYCGRALQSNAAEHVQI